MCIDWQEGAPPRGLHLKELPLPYGGTLCAYLPRLHVQQIYSQLHTIFSDLEQCVNGVVTAANKEARSALQLHSPAA